jgi:hypothetical protein
MSSRSALAAGGLALMVVLGTPSGASAMALRVAPGTPGSPSAPAPRPAVAKPAAPVGKTTLPLVAGDRGTLVGGVQQRLVWLGYPLRLTRVMDKPTLAALVIFRTKFFLGSTPSVTTRVMTKLRTLTLSRGQLPTACRTTGLVLCIDKTQKTLRFVDSGRVLLTTDARFGGEGHPTREGTFRIHSKSRDHVSSLYHTSMPYAMFFSGGQAVHYSPYFHRDGYNGASHGCVNLRLKTTARYLFDHVPVGTRVVVYGR